MKRILLIASMTVCCLGVASARQAARHADKSGTVSTLDAKEQKEVKEEKTAKAKITYSGGDGSSMEKAIVINGAKDSLDGVPAEYAYIKKKYGDYETKSQSLLEGKDGKKYYDMLVFTAAKTKGKEVTLYFDITAFFGKE